jgi:hypothetical protein
LRNRLSCRYSLLNRLLDSFSYSLCKNVTLSRNLFKASLNKDAAPLAGGNSCAFPTTLPARHFLSGSCLVLEVLCGTAGVLSCTNHSGKHHCSNCHRMCSMLSRPALAATSSSGKPCALKAQAVPIRLSASSRPLADKFSMSCGAGFEFWRSDPRLLSLSSS